VQHISAHIVYENTPVLYTSNSRHLAYGDIRREKAGTELDCSRIMDRYTTGVKNSKLDPFKLVPLLGFGVTENGSVSYKQGSFAPEPLYGNMDISLFSTAKISHPLVFGFMCKSCICFWAYMAAIMQSTPDTYGRLWVSGVIGTSAVDDGGEERRRWRWIGSMTSAMLGRVCWRQLSRKCWVGVVGQRTTEVKIEPYFESAEKFSKAPLRLEPLCHNWSGMSTRLHRPVRHSA